MKLNVSTRNEFIKDPIEYISVRFIDKNGPICEELKSKCWNWIGFVNKYNYGAFKTPADRQSKRQFHRVHKLMYELCVGEVPKKMDVDHMCNNRKCCNPEHLQLLTRSENLKKRTKTPDCTRKLNFEKAEEIREKYKKGNITQEELATSYNVSAFLINNIINFRRWKHPKTLR